ncbi:hypothetical protein C2845_PM13G04200 [Panicum miliaceum]|uniref:Uncharacterized protein n=1 Tax=Panicum miliaceum TaxID=4540 RepID=A0A3L6RFV3_PANMI|nr:hypothetical protein C2845_PM13G04200 [Panicum miliaceum]
MPMRRTRTRPEMAPLPSLLPPPLMTLLPPSTPARPWNGGSAFPATRRGAPSTSDVGVDAWPLGFTYDLDVVLPPPPRLPGRRSYADVTTNSGRRDALPPSHALGAGSASPLHEREVVPRP